MSRYCARLLVLVRMLYAGMTLPLCIIRAFLLRRKRGHAITLFCDGDSDMSGERNIGDNAILLSMLMMLDGIPASKLIGISDCEGIYNRYGQEFPRPMGRRKLTGCIPAIRQTGMFLVGGGGIFQDYGRAKITPLSHFLTILLFWIAGRRIMWYSVGVGPLETRQGKLFTWLAAYMSDVITVRDSESKNLLAELGVKERLVHITADPTVLLTPPLTRNGSTPRFKKRLGLSLSPFYSTVYGDWKKSSDLKDIFVAFIESVLSEGYCVRLLAFRDSTDTPFCERVAADINADSDVEIVGRGISVEQMLAQYESLDYLIGMRFHSIVFACVASVPAGPVIYHPKVRALVRGARLEEYSSELKGLTVTKLEYMFARLRDEQPIVKERMRSWLQDQRSKIMENIKLMEELRHQS